MANEHTSGLAIPLARAAGTLEGVAVGPTLSDHMAAVAEAREAGRREGAAEGERRGYDAGAAAALERVRSILTCEAAADRLPHAIKLALGKMPAEEAIAMLPDLPTAKAIPPLAERAGTAVNGLGADNPTPPKEQIDASWKRTYERLGYATR